MTDIALLQKVIETLQEHSVISAEEAREIKAMLGAMTARQHERLAHDIAVLSDLWAQSAGT